MPCLLVVLFTSALKKFHTSYSHVRNHGDNGYSIDMLLSDYRFYVDAHVL